MDFSTHFLFLSSISIFLHPPKPHFPIPTLCFALCNPFVSHTDPPSICHLALDPLLRSVVPRKDPGPGPTLGGAGETPQEAVGQVWQWAAALLWSYVLRTQCLPVGAGSHQVKNLQTPPINQKHGCSAQSCIYRTVIAFTTTTLSILLYYVNWLHMTKLCFIFHVTHIQNSPCHVCFSVKSTLEKDFAHKYARHSESS